MSLMILLGSCATDPYAVALPVSAKGWEADATVVRAVAALPSPEERNTVASFMQKHSASSSAIVPGTTIRQVLDDAAVQRAAAEKLASDLVGGIREQLDLGASFHVAVKRARKVTLSTSHSCGSRRCSDSEAILFQTPSASAKVLSAGPSGCGRLVSLKRLSPAEVAEYVEFTLSAEWPDPAFTAASGCLILSSMSGRELCRFNVDLVPTMAPEVILAAGLDTETESLLGLDPVAYSAVFRPVRVVRKDGEVRNPNWNDCEH